METRTLIPVLLNSGDNNAFALLASATDTLTGYLDTAHESLLTPVLTIGQLNDGTTLTVLYLAQDPHSPEMSIRGGTVPVGSYSDPGAWTWRDIALASSDFGTGFGLVARPLGTAWPVGQWIAAADSVGSFNAIAKATGDSESGLAYLMTPAAGGIGNAFY